MIWLFSSTHNILFYLIASAKGDQPDWSTRIYLFFNSIEDRYGATKKLHRFCLNVFVTINKITKRETLHFVAEENILLFSERNR